MYKMKENGKTPRRYQSVFNQNDCQSALVQISTMNVHSELTRNLAQETVLEAGHRATRTKPWRGWISEGASYVAF